MKYCSSCGSKLEQNQVFCPKCGMKIEDNETEKVENEIDDGTKAKRKTSFGDIIRYILGGLFCFSGISNLLDGDWLGITFILIGISLFPFIYRKYVCKIIRNYSWLKALQIILPICLIFFSIAVTLDDDENGNSDSAPVFKTETAEEKVLRIVKEKLSPTYETITSSNINSETGNYDFKIKEDKSQLSAYVCASDVQYLAKQVVGIEKVGNIEFECAKNGETFYYVSVENVGSISSDSINDNTKYYDANHNSVNTNIDTLKANVVDDYKKACATYNYKDVLRNPSDYKGKQAYWFGEIVQVVDKSTYSSTFRIDVTCEKYTYSSGYYCDDTIYVTYYGDQSFIEDDMVKMWGTMDGTQTYTTVLGASVTIPKFNAQYMELQ